MPQMISPTLRYTAPLLPVPLCAANPNLLKCLFFNGINQMDFTQIYHDAVTLAFTVKKGGLLKVRAGAIYPFRKANALIARRPLKSITFLM